MLIFLIMFLIRVKKDNQAGYAKEQTYTQPSSWNHVGVQCSLDS